MFLQLRFGSIYEGGDVVVCGDVVYEGEGGEMKNKIIDIFLVFFPLEHPC